MARTENLSPGFLKSKRIIPESGFADFRDDHSRKGMSLLFRVSHTGRRTWVLEYRQGDKMRRPTIGVFPAMSLRDARDRADEERQKVKKDTGIAETREVERGAPSFRVMAFDYLENYSKINKRSWRHDHSIIKRLVHEFGGRRINQITREDAIRLYEDMVDSPIMANRTTTLLHTLYGWGMNRPAYMRYILANPFQKLPRYHEEPRVRPLSDSEICRVWTVYSNMGKKGILYKLLLLTGCRLANIAHCEWKDINGNWLTVPVSGDKMRSDHRVFLCKTAKVLISHLENDTRWLFPNQRGDKPIDLNSWGSHRWNKSAVAVADARFTCHNLKDTVLDILARNKVPPHIVEAVGGHRKRGVTWRHYVEYQFDDEKAEAMKVLEAHIQHVTQTGDIIRLSTA